MLGVRLAKLASDLGPTWSHDPEHGNQVGELPSLQRSSTSVPTFETENRPLPTRYRNVIVFGDSLSDIGTKWTQFMGRFARAIGAITVSPSGRFSDCRNWTDHMYEAATGQSLIVGSSAATINASSPHKRFSDRSMCLQGDEAFRYSNYAEGGACAGSPRSFQGRIGLGTFKDQVKRFRQDLQGVRVDADETFLFLVWFGSNDLYTDGQAATSMPGAARKIMKRRAEILQALNAAGVRQAEDSIRFVFMGLGLPMSAARYQRELEQIFNQHQNQKINSIRRKISLLWKSRDKVVQDIFNARITKLNLLAAGALLFNDHLQSLVTQPDMFVGMQRFLKEEAVMAVLAEYDLLREPQTMPKGWSKMHFSAENYDEIDAELPISGSDQTHPTDRAYKYMWEAGIKPALEAAHCSFGRFG